MLWKLSEKVGNLELFPPKKIFGNKNELFIKERMQLLTKYLNYCGRSPNKEFMKFLKQIKDRNFDQEMEKSFKL